MSRDRRTPLFGSAAKNIEPMDVESLERENDSNIAAIGERVGLLKNITSGIQNEVHSQHAVLDRMAQGMGDARVGIGNSVVKFRRVMEDPQGRRKVMMALGTAFALFIVYLWMR